MPIINRPTFAGGQRRQPTAAQADRADPRFHREEEIGEKLDHPGVMKVFGGEDRSRVYMVMEWVNGRLLREIMSNHRTLPVERAIRIAVVVAEALEYIHSQGVVHRDLKPENIMVDDQKRKPWLRTALFYVMLAAIPVVIFSLLLYVARHTR